MDSENTLMTILYEHGGYKIKEIFDPETMRAYFCVYCMIPTPSIIGPQFETLDEANDCVRRGMRDVYW